MCAATPPRAARARSCGNCAPGAGYLDRERAANRERMRRVRARQGQEHLLQAEKCSADDGKIDRSICRSRGGTVCKQKSRPRSANVPTRSSPRDTSKITNQNKPFHWNDQRPNSPQPRRLFSTFRSTCPPREWNGGTILARARLRKKEKRQREPHHPPLAPDCASLALRFAGTALSSTPKDALPTPLTGEPPSTMTSTAPTTIPHQKRKTGVATCRPARQTDTTSRTYPRRQEPQSTPSCSKPLQPSRRLQKAAITERALYLALEKMEVATYWKSGVCWCLRTGERARNIHRLTEIRDAADGMPAVKAVQVLEQIDATEQSRPSRCERRVSSSKF